MVMKYLTIWGRVTAPGPPASICALNFGTTDPFEASTLPNRTEIRRIRGWSPSRDARSRSSAWQYISANRLVSPSIETGSIPLSVEILTLPAAPPAHAPSPALTEPEIMGLTPFLHL